MAERNAPSFTVRLAKPSELGLLLAIDDDATTLYREHGVHLELGPTHAFVQAEQARWGRAAQVGRAFVAVDAARVAIGFAALDVVDGAPYLDQLSVRRAAMGRGVGGALLEQAATWARAQGGTHLWLTTYAHLPFNRPYYERRGFVVVPEPEWGPGIAHHVREQRQALPAPEARVVMRRGV